MKDLSPLNLGFSREQTGGIATFNSVSNLPPTSQFGKGVAQVGSSLYVSNGVGWLKKGKKTTARKWWGGGDGSNAATAFNRSSGFKIESESHFSAVRFWFVNTTTNTPTVIGVCAATETAETDTQDKLARPVKGGVTKNSVDAAAETGGWRTITKNGSANIVLAAGTSATNPELTSSDWIPLKSIDRADGGIRPLLMTRFYINGSLTTWSWVPGDADANLPNLANVNRFLQICTYSSGDAVTTLSNTMTLDNGFIPQVIVEFKSEVDTLTVCAIGDSLIENNGVLSGAGQNRFSNWLHRAVYSISTPERPINSVNLGFSSQNSATYWAYAQKVLTVLKPDYAFFAVFSPNDNANDVERYFENQLVRASEFIEYCRSNNIVPILTTACPKDDLSLSYDNFRKDQNNKIIALGASSGTYVCDFSKALGDKATPEKFISAYKYDNTHFNENAIESALKPIVMQAILNAV